MKKELTIALLSAAALSALACSQALAEETEALTEAVTEAAGETDAAAEAAGEDGVIPAEEWAEACPEIYESYLANEENSYTIDHVEEYPQISTLYEGMAFNTYYNSARGHTYTLEDVAATGRPHALANCLTCKTPNYTALVNELGEEAYTLDFEEVYTDMKEPVSCYNCHGNEAGEGTLAVTHQYLSDAMGEDLGNVKAATLSCGQCHVEYYFAPETKATTLPYDSLEAMNPDAIYSYYQEMGFTDYTNPRTGTQQIKVQHPEFETFMGEGSVHSGTMSCADCHMGTVTSEDGTSYTSHKWQSPLENEELVANTCSACHEDLEGMVKGIQEEAEARTNEIADQLVALTDDLAAAVEAAELSEEDLDEVRALNREAQFYWDFVFVENSEGAHNSQLTTYCLDKAEELTAKALVALEMKQEQ